MIVLVHSVSINFLYDQVLFAKVLFMQTVAVGRFLSSEFINFISRFCVRKESWGRSLTMQDTCQMIMHLSLKLVTALIIFGIR